MAMICKLGNSHYSSSFNLHRLNTTHHLLIVLNKQHITWWWMPRWKRLNKLKHNSSTSKITFFSCKSCIVDSQVSFTASICDSHGLPSLFCLFNQYFHCLSLTFFCSMPLIFSARLGEGLSRFLSLPYLYLY